MVESGLEVVGGFHEKDEAPSPFPDGGCDPLEDLAIRDEHLRRALLGSDFLVFDGAMGTQLQARGLAQAERQDRLGDRTVEEVARDIVPDLPRDRRPGGGLRGSGTPVVLVDRIT